jgi:dihydrofolate synthase/folylpolyglutamate synthase
MNILGDTLELIAAEKAGIIKPGVPVIIGEYQPEIAAVFNKKAALEHSKISFASELLAETEHHLADDGNKNFLDVTLKSLDASVFRLPTMSFHLDLTGTYQVKNLKTVVNAVRQLRLSGFEIGDSHLKSALTKVRSLTGLHGRWETLSKHPLTICDTGHNPEGIQEVLQNIASVPYEKLHFVMGMVNDKDISKILTLLPPTARYYFCKPDIPRGLEAKNLKQQTEGFGLVGDVYPSVKAALLSAQQNSGENDLIFVGGSTFVVAEVV